MSKRDFRIYWSEKIYKAYASVFSRPQFSGFNRILFHLGLRGLGVLNYQNFNISGEYDFLLRFLKSCHSAIVIDIGANEGKYASTVKILNKAVEVYAFEPHPRIFKKLEESAARLQFHAFNYALHEQTGKSFLFDYLEQPEGSEHSSMNPSAFQEFYHKKSTRYEIITSMLDHFIEEKKIKTLDLVKIDAEGQELAILRGARQALRQNSIKVIQFEFNYLNVFNGEFMKSFHDLLPDFHFFRILSHGLLDLKDYDPLEWEIFAFQNIVAVHRQELANFTQKFK